MGFKRGNIEIENFLLVEWKIFKEILNFFIGSD